MLTNSLSQKGVYARRHRYAVYVWGILGFFAGGAVAGILARRRPLFLASVATALAVFFALLYVLSPSLWRYAIVSSTYHLRELISFTYGHAVPYSISLGFGILAGFLAATPRRANKPRVSQKAADEEKRSNADKGDQKEKENDERKGSDQLTVKVRP